MKDKIVEQNKWPPFIMTVVCLSVVIGSFYILLVSNFEQPIVGRMIFVFGGLIFFFLMVQEIKKLRLNYLIKFESDRFLYNDINEKKRRIILFKEIEWVDYTYDNKYIEVKLNSNLKKYGKRVLISKEDIKGDSSKVISIFHKIMKEKN